jgi:modulator of FtsH protease HflC
MNRLYILFGGVAFALVVLLSSIFVVEERERALVLQFGQIKRVINEPGLGFKIPFFQDVVRYDDRIQSLETTLIEVTPSDDRRLVVDAFARWRISDLRQFRQAVGSGGIDFARQRLEGILEAQVRALLGTDQVTSNTILSSGRAELMTRIRDLARSQANNLGVEIIDVRLKQTTLPSQNLQATFERMRAERVREATDERARGGEAAQRVQAQADRSSLEITSEAEKDAEIIRGQADAERNRIFAEAYGQDPEFFAFYRSLAAYATALKAGNTTLVISPDGEFFDYLKGADLAPEPPPQ